LAYVLIVFNYRKERNEYKVDLYNYFTNMLFGNVI